MASNRRVAGKGSRTEKQVADILNGFGRELDTIYIRALKMSGRGGMYHRLNMVKKKSGYDDWKTLHGPIFVGDYLLMIYYRPRDDDAAYNKEGRRRYQGECTNAWVKNNH